ncbi:MAG TPA: holo-ACP synthase [Burkholderiaceae bacterium]|nr:holo-ACP synthase [Burkholderiaceae bacterium]
MIFGIGQDVIEIERVAAALGRHGERFVSRVLGPRELAVYESRRRRSAQRGMAFLATRFAAKEAIAKAVGLGMRQPMSWRSVEIVNEPSGRPCAIANGRFAAFLEGKRLRIHVSVSDIANLAVAHAVAETVDG